MIVLCLLFACAAVALYFNRRIEEALPIGVFGVMLLSYALALCSRLSRANQLGCFVCIVSGVFFSLLCWKRLIKENQTKELLHGTIKKMFLEQVLTPGMLVFILWSIGIVLLFSSHFVTNWDDFNYWANFSKNIAMVDGMVSGASSSTYFKDYTPAVQLLYFVAFKGFGGFRESTMFISNNILLAICLIPFISCDGKKSWIALCRSVVGILFPVAFMFQQLHCLGVDCILSVLFGYLLVLIFFEKRRDVFFYAQLLMGISVLALVKSAGIMCAVIIVTMVFVLDKRRFLSGALSAVCLVAFVMSWRIYCNRSGNTSYLTDKATSSLSTAGFLALPDYAGEVILRFIKNMALFNLNESSIGATPLLCLLIIVGVMYMARLYWKKRDLDGTRTDSKKVVIALAILFAGFIIYIASLLYTYLFVFEKWEALSLSSFDRYISIYLLAMIYLAVYALFYMGLERERSDKFINIGIVVLTVYIVASLNYPLLYNTFAPGMYEQSYAQVKEKRAEVHDRFEDIFAKCPEMRGGRFLIINDMKDNELEKYQQYEAVPSVTFILHLDEMPESDINSNEVRGKISEQLEDHSLDYAVVYDTGEILQ